MQALAKIGVMETKLFLREPQTVFFTFAFPLLMLVVFASINQLGPDDMFFGRQAVGRMVTGFIGMIIATTGLSAMPSTIVAYREQGVLRQLNATPLHPSTIVGGQIAVQLIMTAFGTLLLIVGGIVFYGLDIPTFVGVALVGLALGSLSMFAVGYIIAATVSTTRAATVIGQALFFPMIFLSGATFPREQMPETMQRIGDFLPLTHVINVFQDPWFDQSWNLVSLGVLLGILVIGTVVGTRAFRWE